MSKEKIVYTKYSLASEKVSFTYEQYVGRRMPIDKHVKARLISGQILQREDDI